MRSYSKRVFTGQAIFAGVVGSLLAGTVVGLAGGLLTQTVSIGVGVGAVMFLFSLDVIFRSAE